MKKLLIMLPLVVSLLGCSLNRGGVASFRVVCVPYDSYIRCRDWSYLAHTWMALGLMNPFWYFGRSGEVLDLYTDAPIFSDDIPVFPPISGKQPVKRRISKDRLQNPNKSRRGYKPDLLPDRAFMDNRGSRELSRSRLDDPNPPTPVPEKTMSTQPVQTISPPTPPPSESNSGRESGNRKKK